MKYLLVLLSLLSAAVLMANGDTAVATEKPDDPRCLEKTGYYPVPGDETKYFVCKKGQVKSTKKCSAGNIFNPDGGILNLCITKERDPRCLTNGNNADPKDQAKYVVCFDGKVTAEHTCGSGQKFDPNSFFTSCSSIEDKCPIKNGNNAIPNEPTKYRICALGFPVTELTCPNGQKFDPVSASCGGSFKATCPPSTGIFGSSGFFRNPDKANQYFICALGTVVPKQYFNCTPGELFSVTLSNCQKPIDCKIAEHAGKNVAQDEDRSCRYYQDCKTKKDGMVYKCPSGQLFDYNKGECLPKDQYKCVPKPKCDSTKIDANGNGMYANPENPNEYFECKSKKLSFKQCQGDLEFSDLARVCYKPLNCTAGYGKRFVPLSGDKNCRYYFDCRDMKDGRFHVCPYNFKLQAYPTQSGCYQPQLIECGTKYKCPAKSGYFAHPDPKKHYTCIDESPFVEDCKDNTKFSDTQKKCV